MKRVLVGGFHHESNSFSSITSSREDFRVLRGEELLVSTPNSSLWGIVEGLQQDDVEVVPTLHMRGVPNGEVEYDFFLEIKEEFLEMAREHRGTIDALCLALHGSMRVKGLGEVEGLILEELKNLFPDVPIFVALDMHASISDKMVRYSDGLVGYKSAPHTDCTETGSLAAAMTSFYLREGIIPKQASFRVPMLIAGEKSGTDVEPMLGLINTLKELEQDEEVLAASFFLGYPWADHEDAGVTVSVVTKTDEKKAQKLARELAELFWSKREDFHFVSEAYAVEEALDVAFQAIENKETPVYLSDSGDNPTAGATSDNTELLWALVHEERLETLKSPVIFSGFYDPRSVKSCHGKLHQQVELSIGGHYDQSFSSVPLRGTVEAYEEDYLYAGLTGDVVLFRAGSLFIILSERHIGYTDPQLIRTLGLDPASSELIICKLGYLTPAHQELAKRSILVLTKGNTNEDLESIDYKEIPRPMYPLDQNMTYEPDDNRF